MPHLLCSMEQISFLIGASTILLILFLLRGRRSSQKAPLVHYWIPWVGSAFDMGKDPDAFFRNATDKYGPVFTMKAFGQDRTYVTSPSLISEVYRNSQKFDLNDILFKVGSDVFGIDPACAFSPFMRDTLFPAHRKYLSPQQIKPLLEQYGRVAYEAVLEARDKFNGINTPLDPFISPLAYKAGIHAYFGRSFPAEKSYKPYKEFEPTFYLRLAGVPRLILKKSNQAWDEIIQMIEAYLEMPHEDSCVLVHILEQEVKAAGFTSKHAAQTLSSNLWALQSNTGWAAYWIIVLQMQRPEGLAPLIDEVDSALKSWVSNHPGAKFEENISTFAAEESFPLVASTIQEMLRFSTFSMSLREVQEPVELGGYQFVKGEKIVCCTRAIHLDEDIHENAHSFVPDRYLTMKGKRPTKNGKPVHNHTSPFGGGISQCEGRHFAVGELKILVLLLLLYTTIEMDPESEERPSFAMDQLGTGVLHPKGDLRVNIQKRN